MTRDSGRDEFDGIDINGPWGGIRIGSGGVRVGSSWDDWGDDDDDIRRIRRRVRHKLDFYKNLTFFVVITGGFAFLDGITGGDWWVQWMAIIWGAFIALQFMSTFVAPAIWSRDAEDRMVRREVERNRGRIHVSRPPEEPEPRRHGDRETEQL